MAIPDTPQMQPPTSPWRGELDARSASGGGELSASSPRTPPRLASLGAPPPPGEGEERERAWAAAASVVDPEIPVLSIADLGVLRDIRIENGVVEAIITPTYSGCPAMNLIALEVEVALEDAGFANPKVTTVLSPAWTTDWMTEAGKAILREYGIAPPVAKAGRRALFGEDKVACPQCGAADTERLSEFGSTACKALWRCKACAEPFDYFKCI